MLKIAIIGAGQRGMHYAQILQKNQLAEVVAVVEPNSERRVFASKILHVSKKYLFRSANELFNEGRIADGLIITSMDKEHFQHATSATNIGYNILLEKPISTDPVECVDIFNASKIKGTHVMICHVLRYSSYFNALKRIINTPEIGKIVTIQYSNNIGNFHMAHSFVRGNWRNSEQSSGIVIQNACHDFDVLVWLLGCESISVSSFGNLQFFRKENAPANCAQRCKECNISDDCRFNAYKCYLPSAGKWPSLALSINQSQEGLTKAVDEGQYGRCVFFCDNNVCDHQIVNIEFVNGVTVAYNMSGFTNQLSRSFRIMCEHGEILGSSLQNYIKVNTFASSCSDEVNSRITYPALELEDQTEANYCMLHDFISLIDNRVNDTKTTIEKSLESHFISFAAEKSRITGQVINMKRFRSEL